MTGEEIISLAETYIGGDTIDDSDAIIWLNDWISSLGKRSNVYEDFYVVIDDTTQWNNLPVDFLDIYFIEDEDGEEYLGQYRTRPGRIRIMEQGTYLINYYRIPAEFTNIEEEPDTHPFLHSVAARFIASRYQRKEDENNLSAMLMGEYQFDLDVALKTINDSIKKSPQIIRVVL